MDAFLTFSLVQESGYTALMFAAEAGHLDVGSSLLKVNAQVSLKNKVIADLYMRPQLVIQGGMTAYYLANRSKHKDVAKTLYQAHNVQITLPTLFVSNFVLNRHVLLYSFASFSLSQ